MTSQPPSPIRGFDSRGSPVSAFVSCYPTGVSTRREVLLSGQDLLGPLPPAVRGSRRSETERNRSQSLPALLGNRRLNAFRHSPSDQGSEDSLAWDRSDISVFISDDNRDSVGTPFSGKPSKHACISSSSDEYEDPLDEGGIISKLNLDFLDDDVDEPDLGEQPTIQEDQLVEIADPQ